MAPAGHANHRRSPVSWRPDGPTGGRARRKTDRAHRGCVGDIDIAPRRRAVHTPIARISDLFVVGRARVDSTRVVQYQHITFPGWSVQGLAMLPLTLAAVFRASAAASGTSGIPFNTLPGGGKLPLLVMGDGVGWGRGTNCECVRFLLLPFRWCTAGQQGLCRVQLVQGGSVLW